MIRLLQILFFIVLLIPSVNGQTKLGQKSKVSSKISKETKRADQVKEIEELSAVIERANKKGDLPTLYQANVTLGQINYNNQLYELAVQRYTQAYGLEKMIDLSDGLTVSENLGNAYLALKDEKALRVFQLCIEESEDDQQILHCKEGFSQALYNDGQYDKAIAQLQELENTYAQTDSTRLSRIQALLAKAAAANNDLEYANQNLQNAYSNYKRGNMDDYGVIRSSKEKVLDKTDDDFDKEEYLYNNAEIVEDEPEAKAIEQLDLIKVLVEDGQIVKAEKEIIDIKNEIDKVDDLSIKADLYKQSSETFARKGDYESALNDYKKYEENQSALLIEKEAEINQRLAILESQKNVEITEKTFSSRRERDIAEQQTSQVQRYIIYLLALLLLGSLIAGFIIWRNLRAKNILNKKLQLQSLRSQMNPHFIFNALNSVNEFIATQDERKANKYLSDFSKLMRSVLEVNQKETIDLADEINLTELYLKLEQDRFQDKFEHEWLVDSSLKQSDVQIPPLLLQPYIENAIWHGLRYRDTKGKLSVSIKDEQENILIEIKDNGIGRKNSIDQKTKFQKQHTSTGMKNTKSRMEIVEKLYGGKFNLVIDDASDDNENPGTLVKIILSKSN